MFPLLRFTIELLLIFVPSLSLSAFFLGILCSFCLSILSQALLSQD